MSNADKMTDIVYHYTSLDVLANIVRYHELWATSISYLNDTSERSLYLGLAKDRLPNLLKELRMETPLEEDSGLYTETLPLWDGAMNYYVTSFSREDDSLPQWRAYTPAGLGVQIGFRVEALQRAFLSYREIPSRDGSITPYSGKAEMFPVKYIGQELHKTNDKDLLRLYEQGLKLYAEAIGKRSYSGSLNRFLESRIGKQACQYKSDSFSHERETRLLFEVRRQRALPQHFRSAKSTLIPFLKLNIPTTDSDSGTSPWNAIAEIRLGPSPSQKLNMNAVLVLLNTWDVSVDVLRYSNSTFREL